MSLASSLNTWEIGVRHGGIPEFEVNIRLDGGISEPGTGPSLACMHIALLVMMHGYNY
jgi:hypothetical protein